MKASEFKESVTEVLWIIKTCLTTFWFWLPALYAAYFYIQLWAIFFVHPLTIIILPAILGAYLVREEKKRNEARYQLSSTKRLEATYPSGEEPQSICFKYNIEKNMKRYKELFQKDEKQKETLQD